MKTISEYIMLKESSLEEAGYGRGWNSIQDYNGNAKSGTLLIFNYKSVGGVQRIIMMAGIKTDKEAIEIFERDKKRICSELLDASKFEVGKAESWGCYTIAQCKRDIRFKDISVWDYKA